jgi:hypothetical protein
VAKQYRVIWQCECCGYVYAEIRAAPCKDEIRLVRCHICGHESRHRAVSCREA